MAVSLTKKTLIQQSGDVTTHECISAPLIDTAEMMTHPAKMIEYTPVHLIDEEETMKRPVIERIEPVHPLENIPMNADKLETKSENIDETVDVLKSLDETKSTDKSSTFMFKLERGLIKALCGIAICVVMFLISDSMYEKINVVWRIIEIGWSIGSIGLGISGAIDILKLVMPFNFKGDV